MLVVEFCSPDDAGLHLSTAMQPIYLLSLVTPRRRLVAAAHHQAARGADRRVDLDDLQPGSAGRGVGAPPASPSGLEHRMRFRLLVIGAINAMLVAPITLGYGLEVIALNVIGSSWIATAT